MMTEEGEETQVLGGGRKKSTRERFRARILKKPDTLSAKESKESKESKRTADLDDFLKSPPEADKLPQFPSTRKPVPRIDISSSPRWPDTFDITEHEASDRLVLNENDGASEGRTKPARRKGLVVSFSDAAPLIIGEGGEEAEAPTRWISQMKQSSTTKSSTEDEAPSNLDNSPATITHPSQELSSLPVSPVDDEPQPRGPVRAPTGFGDDGSGQRVGSQNKDMKDTNIELPLPIGKTTIPLAFSTRRLSRQMSEAESQALIFGLKDPSPEPSSIPRDPFFHQESLKASNGFLKSPDAQQRNPTNRTSNHLSPQRPSLPSPSSLSRPSSASSHESWKLQLSSEHSPEREHVRSNQPVPHRKPLPLSNSREPEENPLSEFQAHGSRYYPLFALSVQNSVLESDASLSSWVRAAAWWFLMAEMNFKQLRKYLQEGVEVSQVVRSRRHMQAIIDLSKTVWIVGDRIYDSAKVRHVDISTPEAVDKVIQNETLSSLSCTVQYWQDLLKRSKSLVSAIRRNGLMLSPSDDSPLSTGMDTSIWLRYPTPSAITADWLRSANPHWVRMDNTTNPVEPLDIAEVMPLKGTAKTFLIKTIPGGISGGFSSDDRALTLPCVVTIARRSGSYALVLFMASQDHGINVVIETDPVRGDGIEWQQSSSSFAFNFADGFQLKGQLHETDYPYLKESYELASRLSAADCCSPLQNAALGEVPIFRAASQIFDRRSRTRVKHFPYEGEQKGCEILLFEKYKMLEGMSKPRKAHRRYRLIVMLSRFAPNLGIFDTDLGGERPILIDTMHENSPPRIVLQDSQQAHLVIQFARNRDLDKFYGALTSFSRPANKILAFADVPIRSYSIDPSSGGEAADFLSQASWRNVQISSEEDHVYEADRRVGSVPSTRVTLTTFASHAVFAERLTPGACFLPACSPL
jgi:hypothetical protein